MIKEPNSIVYISLFSNNEILITQIKPRNIRNVVLLGHSGSGKTTFAESMLFESEAIARRGSVQNRNTVSDYTNIERERGNSIFSTLMNVK